ncbi:MAG TPA: protease pro-enzyme activation domain-containing protein [Candidatus Acidoferrales bacterium]|nr:protease pro-enzyme activation domain-containing protein [Candidatus Acidoferrales bacterium]
MRILILSAALLAVFTARTDAAPNVREVPLTLTLRFHQQAQLDRLVQEQADPQSPYYRRFLTVAQFRSYFAPTPVEYAETVASLERQGFRVTGINDNRTLVEIAGSPMLVERTFRTPVAAIVEGATAHYYALRPPRIPRSLPLVAVVGGLEEHQSIEAPPMAGGNGPHARLPDISRANGPDGGYGPDALLKGFDYPVTHGFDGRGVGVADVVSGPDADPDVDVFLREFGIKRLVPQTNVVLVKQPNTNLPVAEQVLSDADAEWILAAAPGVTLTDYVADGYGLWNFVATIQKVVSDNQVDVVNLSDGGCEALEPTVALAISPIFEQGAAQGIAFESLQTNAGCRDPFGNGKSYPLPFPMTPADSPYGLAVGSSNAIENGDSVVAESGWSQSGGGVSALLPSFAAQLSVPGTVPTGRNTPDFTLPGSIDGNGPSYYSYRHWLGGDPVWINSPAAGLLASYVQMTKHRLGAFNVTLYKEFASLGYGSVFSDITEGCETGALNHKLVCARKGYDLVTGIGSFDGYALGSRLK